MKCTYCGEHAMKGTLCHACVHGLEVYYAQREHFENAQAEARDYVRPEPRYTGAIVPDIIKACAECGPCSIDALLSNTRRMAVSRPRMAAVLLIHELTPLTLAEIGLQLGGRHHTTILWAIKRARRDKLIQMIAGEVSKKLSLGGEA